MTFYGLTAAPFGVRASAGPTHLEDESAIDLRCHGRPSAVHAAKLAVEVGEHAPTDAVQADIVDHLRPPRRAVWRAVPVGARHTDRGLASEGPAPKRVGEGVRDHRAAPGRAVFRHTESNGSFDITIARRAPGGPQPPPPLPESASPSKAAKERIGGSHGTGSQGRPGGAQATLVWAGRAVPPRGCRGLTCRRLQ